MLSDGQCDQLQRMMQMEGWTEVVKPALVMRGHNALKALVLAPAEREGEYKGWTDDQIRLRIQEVEWMLHSWENEVKVNAHNRRRDELDRHNGAAQPFMANP